MQTRSKKRSKNDWNNHGIACKKNMTKYDAEWTRLTFLNFKEKTVKTIVLQLLELEVTSVYTHKE